MNYETAQMTAVIHGQLVYIPNQIFQDNVQTLLDAYGMQNENIWTAAQMIDPLYVPKWQWVDRKYRYFSAQDLARLALFEITFLGGSMDFHEN